MNLGNIRLRHKLGAITAIALLGLILTTALGLFALDTGLMDERERQTRSMVEAVYTSIDALHKQSVQGTLSVEEAQSRAKDMINAIRFNEDDYLWVNDQKHVMVIHPIKPELNGKNLYDFKDPNNVYLFREIVEVSKNSGEGMIEYAWPKAGFKKPVDKISYVKLFKPWGWVIGTGVYVDSVQATFWAEATKGVVVFAVVTLLVACAVYFVNGDIANGVHTLSESMRKLAEGDTKDDVPLQDRQDEVGEMAESVSYFRERILENERLNAENRIKEEQDKQRAQAIQRLTSEFDEGVTGALHLVASAAKQLDATANGMSANASQTSAQATAVASASQQTSSNVQTVAAASEELTASIDEVSNQVSISAQIAQKAAERTKLTHATVQALSETAERISAASDLIGSIADQTNLLALNATIEAARAGEAGKGFAVVASEVKNLASQTGKATEEIGAHVQAIQDVSHEAVTAIREISDIIHQMNEIAGSVASAVEEQSAATSEIARNIEQAAAGTQEVDSNIHQVNVAANDTGRASNEVLEASQSLNQQSVTLRNIVENFLTGVRAA